MNAQVDSAPQRESDFRPRRSGDSESRDTGADDAHSRARMAAGDALRQSVFHDLGTSRTLSMLPHTAGLGDAPGYRLPQVVLAERGDRDDRAESTVRLGTRDQTAGPFRSVDSASARQYLHGD